MSYYNAQARPQGAIPALVLDDDEIIRAQAIARQERSRAFLRAVKWGVGTIRRFAA